MRETPILHAVRAALVETGRWVGWRNNAGVDTTRGVRYGLGVGSPDLVGWIKVGERRGLVTCFEVKSGTGRLSVVQKVWAEFARAAGGAVFCVRSVEDALECLARAERGDLGP